MARSVIRWLAPVVIDIPLTHRKPTMNKDQLHGTFKNYIGRVQEELGKLMGSRRQQIMGIQKQVTGQAERRIGDVQHTVRRGGAMVKNVIGNR